MKRIYSLILCFVMLFTISIPTFAEENASHSTITINEYELAERLASETPATLSEKGFDSNEIAEIKNYKEIYRNHIKNLNTLNDDVLLSNGYTNDQISIIRSFTGSDEEMRRLGATLNLNASPSNFRFDGTYTRGTLNYSWSWASIPAFKMQDMVAVSWNNWAVTSNSSNVKYYNVNTGAYYTSQAATFSQDGNGVLGAGHKFKVSLSDNYYYAKSGSGSFTVQSDVQAKKDFYYYMEYGHSQLVTSISFSVGVGGGDASIGFTTGTVAADSAKGSKAIP